jgi:hypothetical protein
MDPCRDIRPVLDRPHSVLAIGTLSAKKGHDVLIRSMALLREQGVTATCRIMVQAHKRPSCVSS